MTAASSRLDNTRDEVEVFIEMLHKARTFSRPLPHRPRHGLLIRQLCRFVLMLIVLSSQFPQMFNGMCTLSETR